MSNYGPIVVDDASGKFVVTSKGASAAVVAQIAKDLAPAGTTTPPPVDPPPASSVTWKPVPHNDWTPSSQVSLSGKGYYAESAETPHSLQISTNTSSPIVRAEVRNNELWSGANGGNDTERAELDGSPTLYTKGTEFWFASSVMVEPGASQISTAGGSPGSALAWCALMQIHSDGNQAAVPWQLSFVGDTLSIRTQQGNQVEKVHWTMTEPFVHGKVYDVVVKIKITGTTASTMTAWVNGVQVANSTGVTIGGPDAHNYPKVGCYRGWQGDGYPPLAVQHANVVHGTASLLARVSSLPAWPK